jgi:hypothetical protein
MSKQPRSPAGEVMTLGRQRRAVAFRVTCAMKAVTRNFSSVAFLAFAAVFSRSLKSSLDCRC